MKLAKGWPRRAGSRSLMYGIGAPRTDGFLCEDDPFSRGRQISRTVLDPELAAWAAAQGEGEQRGRPTP